MKKYEFPCGAVDIATYQFFETLHLPHEWMNTDIITPIKGWDYAPVSPGGNSKNPIGSCAIK
jgi:hypothetical protein